MTVLSPRTHSMPVSNPFSALKNLLDASEIVTDPIPLLTDQRGRYTGSADIVLQPKSIENVQKIMRFCFEHRIPVTPQGGNTGLCGAAVPNGGVLLNLSKLNRIRNINLADNSITVDAGCILKNVQQAAEQADRFFPLSLASEGSCQIGGNIACNAGGLNVLRYGAMRDLVIGLEVVLPDGESIEHLTPLHKNTTGYDLRHLFIGSEGTLGIITGATLKLFARHQSKSTAWVGTPDIESAVHLLSLVQASFAERLISYELISDFALTLSSEFSKLSPPTQAPWHVLIELGDSLPHQNLDDILAEFLYEQGFENAVLAHSEAERMDLWILRENISASQRKLGASIKHDIALPIKHTAEFIKRCATALKTAYPEIQIVVFGHLGDGSLHYNTFLPQVLSNEVYRYEDAINTIVYNHVIDLEGTIAAEHGIGQVKNQWLPQVRSKAEIDLMRAIKAQLDPHNILNPGKLLP
ncbi:D-lactate dehydrogenase (cytochrome) [Neisseria wadsworthii 9715]|uniref:D-lactate dehydrogenase (Cytochrome) n=2 Tax=Neisseria TaxID=482 RepID=G4CT41_9NEIS|nr:D-lactate dehydrogenase (cytochrome) [Neisseria wadsworthii 9715]